MTRRLSLVLAATALWIGLTGGAVADVEQPSYDVARAEGPFELRDYPALVTARTVEAGDRGDASSPAFRRLARYISEEDRPQGPIAMTAPVLMSPDSAGRTAMQFVMPEKFDVASLPAPEDPSITLQAIPARRMAVIRFSGWAGDQDLLEQETRLRAWLAENGLVAIGAAEWAFYNPPWTLGPWRRNEVMIEVAR